MDIFHYHPDTRIYVGMSKADPSPLEAGKFLIPAYATSQPVLVPREGFDVVFDGARWNYQEQPKPPEPTDEALAIAAIAQRSALLTQSDYTQLPDVQAAMTEAQNAAWLEYRQQLRDITAQPGFPRSISWPEKPV